MSDHHTRDPFADGLRDENFAEFADELRLLAEAVLERVEPVLRKTAADGRSEWSSCSWCPVCAAAALVRGEHHDVVAAIADHGTSIVTVLREALAGVPVEPVVPPELDPDSPEYAAAHQHSHTNGSSDGDSIGGHGPGDSPSSVVPGGHRAANPDAAGSNSPTGSGPVSGAGVAGGSSFWSNVATNLRSPGRDSGSGGPAQGGAQHGTPGGVPDAGPSASGAPGARGEHGAGNPGQATAGSSSRSDWFTSGGSRVRTADRVPGSGNGPDVAGRGVSGRGGQGAGRQAPARPGYVPIPVTIKPPTT